MKSLNYLRRLSTKKEESSNYIALKVRMPYKKYVCLTDYFPLKLCFLFDSGPAAPIEEDSQEEAASHSGDQ